MLHVIKYRIKLTSSNKMGRNLILVRISSVLVIIAPDIFTDRKRRQCFQKCVSVILFAGGGGVRCHFLSGTMFLPGSLLSGPMFLPEGSASKRGGLPTPWYWHLVAATATAGTYVTGMHSCHTILSG